MDIDPERVDVCKKKQVCMHHQMNLFAVIYLSLTDGYGFDHVFICADTLSNEPIEMAGGIARDRANVIAHWRSRIRYTQKNCIMRKN